MTVNMIANLNDAIIGFQEIHFRTREINSVGVATLQYLVSNIPSWLALGHHCVASPHLSTEMPVEITGQLLARWCIILFASF